jgi:4-hydroxy-tetrahydrodipicolinate synthase
VALLTPFDELGRIDYSAFGRYLDYLGKRGIQTIIVNGSTAEFTSLTLDERKKNLEYCRSGFDGCLINNVSSSCIGDVQTLLNHSRSLSDFVLVLPPYYYADIHVDGARAFFEAVLASTDQPVLLYNFPRHTQFKISPELIKELKIHFKNLIGIKDSSGILNVAKSYARIQPPFSVYVGNDRLSLNVLQEGLSGSVTGAGSSFPECLVKIREYYELGATHIAREVQTFFNQWNGWRKEIGGDEIALTKQSVAARLPGFPANVRPPKCRLSDTEADMVTSKALAFADDWYKLLKQISQRSI